MALKREDEFQTYESVDSIDIHPDEGEAWRVKRIELNGVSDGQSMEIDIGKSTVGYFLTQIHSYPIFPFEVNMLEHKNLFDALKEIGINLIYPVAKGEHFILKFSSAVDLVKVTYDVYDEGDVKPTEPNGSKSDTLTFLNYISNSFEINDGKYYSLDVTNNPKEMPDFPIGDVPSGMKVTIHSIGAIPVAKAIGDGTNQTGSIWTKFLRIWHRRRALYDPNKEGFNVLGNKDVSNTGTTYVYDYSQIVNDLPMQVGHNAVLHNFKKQLDFIEGDEVNIQIACGISGNAKMTAGDIEVYVLETIKKA